MRNMIFFFLRLNFIRYFVLQNHSDQSLSIFSKLYTQLEDTLNYNQEAQKKKKKKKKEQRLINRMCGNFDVLTSGFLCNLQIWEK